MITKRLNVVETSAKVFCGNCEQEASECSICGDEFWGDDYIKCVCYQDMYDGKEYFHFAHLCSHCKEKKIPEENQ